MENKCLVCKELIKEKQLVLDVMLTSKHGYKILGQWIGTSSGDFVYGNIHITCINPAAEPNA